MFDAEEETSELLRRFDHDRAKHFHVLGPDRWCRQKAHRPQLMADGDAESFEFEESKFQEMIQSKPAELKKPSSLGDKLEEIKGYTSMWIACMTKTLRGRLEADQIGLAALRVASQGSDSAFGLTC